MKDINQLNGRMDEADEIIDGLVKKTVELEKQIGNIPEIKIPDHTASLEKIIEALNEIKLFHSKRHDLDLLNTINSKLDKLPKSSQRQVRFLSFPETNQGQYYKIVFGRLIPWGLVFVVATYIFITGYKAIGIYRFNQDVRQSMHYQRAWLYLQRHAKKKTLNSMEEAYNKTVDK